MIRASYRFARIPEWVVFHPGLDSHAIRLFGILDRHDGEACHPKLATIAELMGGVSEQTVRRALRALESVGAVRTEARYRTTGTQTSNAYVLAGDEPLQASPNLPGMEGRPSTDGRGDPSRDGRARKKNESKKEPDSSPSEPEPPPTDGSLQEVLAHFVDTCREHGVEPSGATKSKLAGHVARLHRKDGKPVKLLRMAVYALAVENKPPGLIDLVVADAERELAGTVPAPTPRRNGHEPVR